MDLKEFSDGLELAGMGFANGKAPGYPFTEKEKWSMVDEAAEAYGKFLDALGCDWRNDPNSSDSTSCANVRTIYPSSFFCVKGKFTFIIINGN